MVGGLATQEQVIAYFVLGTVGSLLPDLDADNSTPVQIAFSLSSLGMAFVIMFAATAMFDSVIELVLIWLTAYLVFRWFIFALFARFTKHRGVFHSVPAAVFFGLLTATVSHHILGYPPLQAWMNGMFVCFGYVVHLILDELYSVNVFGMRTRKSFGTALKLYSKSGLAATLALYLATLALFLFTPDTGRFTQTAVNAELYREINRRLLPDGRWFEYPRSTANQLVVETDSQLSRLRNEEVQQNRINDQQ